MIRDFDLYYKGSAACSLWSRASAREPSIVRHPFIGDMKAFSKKRRKERRFTRTQRYGSLDEKEKWAQHITREREREIRMKNKNSSSWKVRLNHRHTSDSRKRWTPFLLPFTTTGFFFLCLEQTSVHDDHHQGYSSSLFILWLREWPVKELFNIILFQKNPCKNRL